MSIAPQFDDLHSAYSVGRHSHSLNSVHSITQMSCVNEVFIKYFPTETLSGHRKFRRVFILVLSKNLGCAMFYQYSLPFPFVRVTGSEMLELTQPAIVLSTLRSLGIGSPISTHQHPVLSLLSLFYPSQRVIWWQSVLISPTSCQWLNTCLRLWHRSGWNCYH